MVFPRSSGHGYAKSVHAPSANPPQLFSADEMWYGQSVTRRSRQFHRRFHPMKAMTCYKTVAISTLCASRLLFHDHKIATAPWAPRH